MGFMLYNTQEPLKREAGKIYPSVRAYLSSKMEWTLIQRPKIFSTQAKAEACLAKSGLVLGRNEDPATNTVNILELVPT